jgi:coenzyme F420 hydrogenase subunit beta
LIRQIKTLKDVVDWGLCTGCGACAYACKEGAISLVNIEAVGIRPSFALPACESCTTCLSICPGYNLNAGLAGVHEAAIAGGSDEFGPAHEIWEGYATDQDIRFHASSGGLLSALALYCLEQEGMAFVLHTGMNEEYPWLNKTLQSRTRQDIKRHTGSRYAPSSPCEGLRAIEESEQPCVFIGKPCDTAAVWMLRQGRPDLDRNLGLVLTFFCAGTPSTKGTLDLSKTLGVESKQINDIRYRGLGWPGRFKITYDNGSKERSLSYEESWGSLTSYRPLRCNLCPDGLGRIADISCGDAWQSYEKSDDPGRSLVIVRTSRGKEILRRAIAANYVQLERVTSADVLAAQVNLLGRRKELFGRLLAFTLFFIPTPRFVGFSMFRSWIRLPFLRKGRTILGTAKRILKRSLWRRRPLTLDVWDSPSEEERQS